MPALPPALDRALLDELRQQHSVALNDMQLFDGIVRALEAMTPEGRAMAFARLSKTFPTLSATSRFTTAAQPSLPLPPRTPARSVDLRDLSYGDAAEAVLDAFANNRPLSTRALLSRLATGGKPVTAKDPYRVLYRTLAKNKKFVNIGGQWALAEWFPDDEPLPVEGERAAAKETSGLDAEEQKRK